jgi:hypothetical protein
MRYVWIASNNIVAGATGPSLTLTREDQGDAITVQVFGQTGTLEAGCTSAWNEVTATAPLKVPFTAAPYIVGTRAVGSTLRVVRNTEWTIWTANTFTYAWYANGVYIPGTVGHTTFKPTLAQKGKRITARVTGSRPGYATASRMTAATAKIAQTSAPTISGIRKIGYTLTAHPGTWTAGTHLVYKWYSDENDYIPGSAGHATLKLTGAMFDKSIRVTVTGSLSGYQTITRSSGITVPVRPRYE